jgi:hypothetical protein
MSICHHKRWINGGATMTGYFVVGDALYFQHLLQQYPSSDILIEVLMAVAASMTSMHALWWKHNIQHTMLPAHMSCLCWMWWVEAWILGKTQDLLVLELVIIEACVIPFWRLCIGFIYTFGSCVIAFVVGRGSYCRQTYGIVFYFDRLARYCCLALSNFLIYMIMCINWINRIGGWAFLLFKS